MRKYVLYLCIVVLLVPKMAHAQGFEKQVLEMLSARGVPATLLQDTYDDLLVGVYNTFRHAAANSGDKFRYNADPRYARSAARILMQKFPSLERFVINRIPNNIPNLTLARENFLRHSVERSNALQRIFFRNQNIQNFVTAILRSADTVSGLLGCATGCSILQVLRHEATQGGKSSLQRIASSIGKRFGVFLEWLSTHTAQRILGIYTIADFTQGHINEALHAFQDEMEAIGDASEAEAYNNNVRLIMMSLESGRSCLVSGMTLGRAMRQLHLNMNKGGKFFENIVRRREGSEPCNATADGGEKKSACSCDISPSIGDTSQGCTGYAEFHDKTGKNVTFHIVDNARRHAGWAKPGHWKGGIGGTCDYVQDYFKNYCGNFCS